MQRLGRFSPEYRAPKITDVFDTIANVSAILPHAIEGKIPNRAGFGFEALGVRWNMYLDYGSFVDGHVLKGLEDAVLVLCRNSHGFLIEPSAQNVSFLTS